MSIDLQMTAYHQALSDAEAKEALRARRREAKALAALVRLRVARARFLAVKERRDRLAAATVKAANLSTTLCDAYNVAFDAYERAVAAPTTTPRVYRDAAIITGDDD